MGRRAIDLRDRILGLARMDQMFRHQVELEAEVARRGDEHAATLTQIVGHLDELRRRVDDLASRVNDDVAAKAQGIGDELVDLGHVVRNVLPGRLYESYDVLRMAELRAGDESARFFNDHLYDKLVFRSDLDLLTHAAEAVQPGDLILEFGTWSGRTITHLAEQLPTHQLYGFDSFEGLPETWRSDFTAGTFDRDELPKVPDNVELVVGWFDATLEDFLTGHDGPVGFVHVDCDLYSSTKYVLDTLAPRLRDDAVLVFDEFFNYPGWQHHEAKAYDEFLAEHGFVGEFLGCNVMHQQVAVKVRRR